MNTLFKLNLRKKILLGFGLVMLILLVVFVVSLSSLLKLGKASEAILKQNYLSIEATHKMLDAIEQHYRLSYANQRQKTDELAAQALDEQLDFEHWLLIEKGNITEAGERLAVRKLESAYKKYLIEIKKYQEKRFPSLEQAQDFLNREVRPYLNQVRIHCLNIRDINQSVMFHASNNAKLIAHKATYTLTLIGILGLLLAVVFSLSLSSLIVRPLKNMLLAIEKVSQGDYSVRVPDKSADEFGIVSNQFNHMAEKLSEYHELNIRNILREKQINEAILQGMDDGFLLLDTEFHIANINLSGARFFKTVPENCRGKHILEVVKNEELFEHVKATAETGKSPAIEENRNILSGEINGSKQYLQYYLTPIFLPKEELIGIMILLQDITHLKQLDKLKSEFLMIASHELKTPLTSIKMSIALLQEKLEGRLDEPEKELLQIAVDDTNRLKALISDLLDISKIEAGKIELNLEKLPVESILDKALQSFSTVLQEKKINVQKHCEPDLLVKGDFSKITWILTNLLSNAIRFTPEQGQIVTEAVKTGSFVQFSVKDNGIGIPYEHQKKIFDKFYQVASPQNTGGTGLGLSICKEIVRAHGGSIWVESEPGSGSTFYFSLPLA